MANAILRQPEVQKRLGISSSTLWYRLDPRNPRFDEDMPKPFKLALNGRAVGWLESEIDAYIEKRAAVRVSS